jgi:hypothetical protein
VRGYQRVDFEIENQAESINIISNLNDSGKDDNELFENLILEGNYLEYSPKKIQNFNLKNRNPTIKKEMSLRDIYNEFWEFIDESNEKFKVFIDKDLRRSQNPLIY